MALLDPDANEIVIRVVYDGPPEAGKTTSMRALAASLAQVTVTPEEDAAGRTLWFDWMEYVGGRFEGSRIRCQIVSVPGQRELRSRRRLLLRSADVVVFVGDSTPARWDLSIEYLFELRRMLSGDPDGPPIGVVFQANKRDAPNAIDLDGLRLRLGDARWSVGVVESVAAEGTGIREAFVYGVRLALDRVRELMAHDRLARGSPELTSPAQLLAQLQAETAAPRARGTSRVPLTAPRVRIASAPDSLAAALLREVLAAEDALADTATTAVADTAIDAATGARGDRAVDAATDARGDRAVDAAADAPPAARSTLRAAPRPPDATVPSGAIWPPVEGRAILYEVSQLGLRSRVLGNGDWSAGLGSGWRIVSARDASFDSLDAGRAALIAWARLHAACAPAVSPRRCIVLAATGDGRWRLWQIVRAEPPLRDYLTAAAREPTAELAVYRLCQTAQLLVDVHERLAQLPCDLPCSLDTVGQSDASAVYIGLMPGLAAPVARAPLAAPALLAAELGPMLALELADQRDDLQRALERIPHRFLHAETVVASLATLLA